MEALEELASLVHRESGILIREAQHNGLTAALKRVDPVGDPAQFIHRAADPVTGPALVARLLDEVTVKETFFLRHAPQLEQIRWHELLTQARQRGSQTIRVWSAACATGEEAYTLALLAREAFAPTEPPVTILATDISEAALAQATTGAYRTYSTRELNPVLRRRYFEEDGDKLTAGKQLRSLVTFARHNLVRDPAPPRGEQAFDLILCRNVLIYFDSETVDRVTAALDRALAPGGTLILGAADALCRGAGHLRALATAVTPLARREPQGQSPVLRRPLGRLSRPSAAHDPAGVADAARAGESDEMISRAPDGSSPPIRSTHQHTSSTASPSSRQAMPTPPSGRSAERCTPSHSSDSPHSSSAAPTSHSETVPPRAARTSRPYEPATPTANSMSRCSDRST